MHALDPIAAAKILGISRPSLYLLIRKGDLRAVRCGRLWRVDERELEKFLRGGRPTDARTPDPAEAA